MIGLYYLLTPVFVILDLAGVVVRVPLQRPAARAVYYLVLLGLGLLCRAKPATAPWVGMGESAVNLALLMAAVLLPVWGMGEALVAGGEPISSTELLQRTANLALAGSVLVWSFHRNQRAALGGPP